MAPSRAKPCPTFSTPDPKLTPSGPKPSARTSNRNRSALGRTRGTSGTSGTDRPGPSSEPNLSKARPIMFGN